MLKKSFIGVVLLTSVIYLNAEEVVSLQEDSSLTQALAKDDSRKNDDVQFALELGAKTNFWKPGLSKEHGGEELLKYDTEGLHLGYAKFKTKIYGTDVLTLEKYTTLKSSDTQSRLLSEYKDDRKKDSSFQGYRTSIQVMKIMNYLLDTNILNGIEYSYTTRNFTGSATLQKDSIYWFGNNPGNLNSDYSEYAKDQLISFQTKFTNQELLYRFGNLFNRDGNNTDGTSMRFMLGAYKENWEKPTNIGTSFNGKPIIYDGEYQSKGALVGLELGSKIFNLGLKYYAGLNNNFKLTNNYNASDVFNGSLGMDKFDIYFIKKYPKIYSTNYFDVSFLITGNYIYSLVSTQEQGASEVENKDAETLYDLGLAFEITF